MTLLFHFKPHVTLGRVLPSIASSMRLSIVISEVIK